MNLGSTPMQQSEFQILEKVETMVNNMNINLEMISLWEEH